MKTIIVIDPFVSYHYVYQKLKQAGVYTVAIITNPSHQKTQQLEQLGYDEFHVVENDFQVAQRLIRQQIEAKQLDLVYILNGSDDSSLLVERLICYFLPHYSNGPKAQLRTDKFAAIEELKKRGLSHQNQLTITQKNYDQALSELKHFAFPVILKPNQFGSGKEAVTICESVDHVNQEIFTVSHGVSKRQFDSYLVQEFMQGDEYIIDTVSIDGCHHVTGVYRYIKHIGENREIAITGIDWLNCDGPLYSKLVTYVSDCLDQLEVSNGVNHTEIMLLDHQSVELIEINPRLSGGDGVLQDMALYTTGSDQYSYLFQKLGFDMPLPCSQQFKYTQSILFYDYHFKDRDFCESLKHIKSDFCKVIVDKQKDEKRKLVRNFHDVRKMIILADNCHKTLTHDYQFLEHYI